MPTASKFTTSELPPKLINGSGTPVNGMAFVTESIFRRAWIARYVVMPVASSLPNGSLASILILMPR